MKLVIVARDRPDLYEGLANRFAHEPQVRVIFDRRSPTSRPASIERRHDENEGNADLVDRGYTVISTG